MIATGQRTGEAANPDEIRTIRDATHLALLVGPGVTEDNVELILSVNHGVIVASSLKEGGVWWDPVDPDRVKSFVAVASRALES